MPMWQEDDYYRPSTLAARDNAVDALTDMLSGMVEELAETVGADGRPVSSASFADDVAHDAAEVARVATFLQSIMK